MYSKSGSRTKSLARCVAPYINDGSDGASLLDDAGTRCHVITWVNIALLWGVIISDVFGGEVPVGTLCTEFGGADGDAAGL